MDTTGATIVTILGMCVILWLIYDHWRTNPKHMTIQAINEELDLIQSFLSVEPAGTIAYEGAVERMRDLVFEKIGRADEEDSTLSNI